MAFSSLYKWKEILFGNLDKLIPNTFFTFLLLLAMLASYMSEHWTSFLFNLQDSDDIVPLYRRRWQAEEIMILAFSPKVERWSDWIIVSRRNKGERLAENLGVVKFQWGQKHDRKMCSLWLGDIEDKYKQRLILKRRLPVKYRQPPII